VIEAALAHGDVTFATCEEVAARALAGGVEQRTLAPVEASRELYPDD
jgi:hypothetical protein